MRPIGRFDNDSANRANIGQPYAPIRSIAYILIGCGRIIVFYPACKLSRNNAPRLYNQMSEGGLTVFEAFLNYNFPPYTIQSHTHATASRCT
jgi:hypothetical protein